MARIWTFGYPADITFQTATIYELALTLLDRVKGVRKGQEVGAARLTAGANRTKLIFSIRTARFSGCVTHSVASL